MKRKMMRKNQKGFTIIELLVVILIIGIITVLALPGVQQLQSRNYNKKYETYADTVESAAKLYTDAYSDDMFGTEGNGCFDITYSELHGKSLLKDYATDGVTCDDADTFVQVKRESGKYTYDVSMKCKSGSKVVYDKVLSSCYEQALETSDIPLITVDIINDGGTEGWSTSKDITITVASRDGLDDNVYISYGWTTDPNILPADMKTYNFRNDTGKSEVSMTFTESGKNGVWYLVIDGDNIIDVGGRFATDEIITSIKFDNTIPEVPVLNNPYEGVWVGDAIASAGGYVIDVASSDTPSGIREYQYRYPNSSNTWTSYSNSNSNNFTTTPFTSARDEIVEIRACDYAGNCSAPVSSHIRIDRTAPTCTVDLSGTTGENGWYKTQNVSVTLSTTDDVGATGLSYDLTTSATATYAGTSSGTQGNTTGITWYGYVKDRAGNVGSCDSGSFKVDTLVPTCTVNLSGTSGDNGWYKANDVSVSLTRNDTGGSTLASYDLTKSSSATYAGTATGTQGNTTGITWYGYVKDKAGNIGSCSKNFKVDKTSPTCSVSLSGTSGDNGWYKAKDVSVSLTRNDTGGSSVGSYDLTTSTSATYAGTASSTQGNTTGITWYGYVKDNAGNTGSCNSVSFKVDKSSPTCTVTFSGTSGDNGWYKAKDATATVNPTENGSSGIAAKVVTTSATATYSGNATGTQGNTSTSGTKWYGYVKDNAGNVGSCSNTVKVDKSSPTCTVTFSGTSGENGWYKAANATATVNPTENGNSGIAAKVVTTSSSATYSGSATGSQGNTSTSGTKWYGYVKDTAGNVGSCNNTVKVDKSSPSCTLGVNTSGVYFASHSDSGNSGVAAAGVNKSTSASYSASSVALASSTYYGHVKDAAGNTGRCQARVFGTTSSTYACSSYSYKCGTTTYSCTESYSCCTAMKPGYDICVRYGTCTRTATCSKAKYCTGYNYCTSYSCSSGTKLNDSWCYTIG